MMQLHRDETIDFSDEAQALKLSKLPHVTVDMLQAFVSLAETLNLSDTTRQLGVTRQTIKRHLDQLETIRGLKLFHLDDRRYVLTQAGAESLQDAREILGRCAAWTGTKDYTLRRIDGFEHAKYEGPDGRHYYAQQHPVGRIGTDGPKLLKEMFTAWGQSLSALYHPAMDRIRPYLVIYRRTQDSWICVNVGEASAYARWFGQDAARSNAGVSFDEDLTGVDFNAFISKAYLDVHHGGTMRLDHIHAKLPRHPNEPEQPVSFQRLLTSCLFPDGQQALAALIVITNNVSISSLQSDIPCVSDDLLMDDAL